MALRAVTLKLWKNVFLQCLALGDEIAETGTDEKPKCLSS